LECLYHIYESVAGINAEKIHSQPGYKIAKSVIDGTSSPFGNSKFLCSLMSSEGGDKEAKVRFSGLQDFRGVMKSGGRAMDPWVDEHVAAVLHRLAIAVSWTACTTYVPQLDEYYHKFLLDKTRPDALMNGLIRNLEQWMCREYFNRLFVQGNRMYGIQMGIERPQLSIEGQLDDLLRGETSGVLSDAGLSRLPGKLTCIRHRMHEAPPESYVVNAHIELSHSGVIHAKPRLSRTTTMEVPALVGEARSW